MKKDKFVGFKATDTDEKLIAGMQEKLGADTKSEAIREIIRAHAVVMKVKA